jgi:hypothetical protein
MTQNIIYPNGNGGICLVVPTGELAIEDVARKDVPAGVPYRIINQADVPADHTFFSAWEADFSNPDGHGIGADAWFALQEKSK